jgi:circadian clock protein KaiB
MPGGTGTWMLHEATRQGLMNGAIALIVTAHPDIRDLGNVEVISKPLDLDQFLEQVRRILGTGYILGSSGLPPASRGDTPQRPNVRAGRYLAELVLYVSSASPASIQARRNLERLLDRFDTSQIKFSVCDLAREPLAGEADRVAFTPTLVKRYPEPRMWVLGNLKDPEIVAGLLHACGIEPKE